MTALTPDGADPHLAIVQPVPPPTRRACLECVRLATPWVHLRQCLTCGQVGCCDSSPMRHARTHAHATGHVVVRSIEPGERWRWCYVHEQFV
ncbi:MAG: zinc finger, UBP-type [Nocardioides sp.]|nr:zinc finger, UBP-type [Nocardioides sp.]